MATPQRLSSGQPTRRASAETGLVVVAGEALVDRIVRPDGSVVEALGGGPFNTARTIARLGVRCAFLGCLSTDRWGRQLDDALRADGVDRSLVRRAPAPTTGAIATIDAAGEATYRFETEGTSAAALPGAQLPLGAVALHVGTLGLVLEPIGSTLEALVGGAPDHVLVMLDVNARPAAIRDPEAWRVRVRQVLQRADVVKASAADLTFLRMLPAEVAATAPVVLVTDGARDVEVLAAGSGFRLPVPPVQVVDTVGSGDAFGGGFLAWWMGRGNGRTELADTTAVRAAAEAAIAVAALTCTRAGADPPRRREVEAFRG